MPCVTAAAVPRRARDELLDQWRVAIRALLRGFQRFDLATGSECRGARCRTRGPLQIPRQDVAQTDGDELLTVGSSLDVDDPGGDYGPPGPKISGWHLLGPVGDVMLPKS